MNKNVFLYVLLFISSAGLIFFGGKLVAALVEYKKGSDIYNQISEIAYETDSLDDQVTVSNTAPDVQKDEENTNVSGVVPAVPELHEILSPIPETILEPVETVTRKKSSMNFDKLLKINEDVKGWIRLEESKVDYPILQYKDNDFYLHHAITGEWNKVGTPYIDYRCAGDFSDRITVVYGHYMENGTMFTDFHKYKGQKYYEEHPVIDLFTPSGDYKILPVAGVFQNVEYWDFTFDFYSDEAFLHYIDNWKAVSTFKNDVPYDSSDRFIVLTLCTYDIENGRFLLVGKLQPV